jgi:uncharacterized protein (DUF58 family)
VKLSVRIALWIAPLAALWAVWLARAWLGTDWLGAEVHIWLPLGSVLWVLLALANTFRIYPYRGLVLAALLPSAAALGVIVSDLFLGIALAADAAVMLVALADLATLPRRRTFAVERQLGRVASLKQAHRVALTVINHGAGERTVWLRDGADQELNAFPEEFTLRLAGRSRATVQYQIRSARRGAFTLRAIHLRVRSRLALWQRYIDYPLESVLHVYPDMKQLSEYAILARKNRLQLLGVRRTRRIGQDNEFERLRDYSVDDNFRHIDWRATARRRKLTVKDFQVNQSQRLVFLLDCGRMMTNEAAGLSLLDHALNAMLMLSYEALAHGDAVGLLCFSDEIHGYVPPRSGQRQMNRLLHAAFDRFPRLVESRYDEAFLYLSRHQRRRSLVVLVTNVIDEVNAHQVEQYLGTLVGRHLPLGVLLRDRRLFDAADMKQAHERTLYEGAAAADILSWRHQVLADLNAKGVLSLDVFPEEMTAPLINRYLEIKARHLL